jgi:hypothetical protein
VWTSSYLPCHFRIHVIKICSKCYIYCCRYVLSDAEWKHFLLSWCDYKLRRLLKFFGWLLIEGNAGPGQRQLLLVRPNALTLSFFMFGRNKANEPCKECSLKVITNVLVFWVRKKGKRKEWKVKREIVLTMLVWTENGSTSVTRVTALKVIMQVYIYL